MNKISFVVIAKNEIFNIEKCIHEIVDTAECLDDYEIVFVDSASTDGTMQKVQGILNGKIRIIQITLNPNAARARNLGADCAQFEYIFFIDGDVVIDKAFLLFALDELRKNPKVGCVLGQLEEIQYSKGFGSVQKVIADRLNINERSINRILPGGIFMVRKAVYTEIHGMDERFDIYEDRDLGLRILKGHQIIAVPYKMGTHHTVSYRDIYRIFSRLSLIRFIGLLLRRNFFDPKNLFLIVKLEYGLFLGMAAWVILGSYFIFHNIILLFIFLTILLFDLFKGLKVDRKDLPGRLVEHYFYPFIILESFILFYPKKIQFKWIEINR